ncbi:MAG: DUF2948 family protein [Geminicoccaceae bacterium]
MTNKMRLRAQDGEDLAIIAAILQDARVQVRDLVYMADEGRFLGGFQRYRRECASETEGGASALDECEAALSFGHVRKAEFRGLEAEDLSQEYTFFTMTDEIKNGAVTVTLLFQEGAAVRLITDRIECRLEDIGEPRPCGSPPPEDEPFDEG